MMARRFRSEPTIARVGEDAASFTLSIVRFGESEDTQVFLGNVFEDWQRAERRDREAILEAFVRAARGIEVPTEWADAKGSVRARLWPLAYESAEQLRAQYDKRPVVSAIHRHLGSHLILAAVYDGPDSVAAITPERVTGWGQEGTPVLDLACENIRRLPSRFRQARSGVFVSDVGDSYDATRILLIDAIAALPLDGDPIALVPEANVLIVTGENDAAGLAWMAKAGREALAASRTLSGIPLRLRGGQWSDWTPPPDHLFAEAFRTLRNISLDIDYQTQRPLIEAIIERDGPFENLGPFWLREDQETGEIRSITMWANGANYVMPRTDLVAFFDDPELDATVPPAVLCLVAWETVAEIAGDLMHSAEIYPARFRVDGFPDPDQLGRLKEHGIDPAYLNVHS